MVDISLRPNESREIVFILGQAADLDEVGRLVHEHTDLERAAAACLLSPASGMTF